jgi:cytochrome P450
MLQMATVEMGERRKHGVTDRPDMLGKAFKLQREKPMEYSDSVLKVIAAQNVIAGSDTTAIAMRATFYHLLKNPEYMARLKAEVQKNRAQGLLSNPVTFEQARRMPYLQACISEGLRIHPAVGMTLPRVVPAGGMHIHGYFLPEGVCRSSC